jgi:hypothetical protein
MRKIFIFLIFVNSALFAQRQEAGRIYFEVRALETPWTGYVPSGFNRDDYRTGEIHFSTTLVESELDYDPILYSDYNGDSAIKLYIKSSTSESRKPSHIIVKEVTDTSYIIQLSYHKDKKMSFLNYCINFDSFDPEKRGDFRDTVRNICILHRLTYVEDFDWEHEESYWISNFDVHGYYRCKIEFILYKGTQE